MTERPPTQGGLGSVDNALRLLLLLRQHEQLGVTEAASRLGVAGSTAHRLLTSMGHHDFVRQDPTTRAYRAGPALGKAGGFIVERVGARPECLPHLIALSEDLGETVNLVVLRGADALFIYSVESRRPLRIGSREGIVMPAHAISAGKALLAALSSQRLRSLYPDPELQAVTKRTLRTRAALERQLADIRRRGYATNIGESEPDITAAGAAVPDAAGGERLAVAVSAPSSRVRDEDDLLVVGEAARACADNVARALEAI